MISTARTEEETALACKLPDEDFDRRRVEAGALFASALRIAAIDGGVELAFAADDDSARSLLDFVLYERRCCPTLSYALAFEKGHDEIKLVLRGARGLVELVESWRSSGTGAMRAGCACASAGA